MEKTQTRARLRKSVFRRNLEGYLLISPWLVGFLLFIVGPAVASLLLSFMSWDIVGKPRWIGLDNYTRAFTGDPFFGVTLYNTFYYVLGSVPACLVLAIFVAMLLKRAFLGVSVFRTLFYLPSVTSLISMAFVWAVLLEPRSGVVNYLLSLVGIRGPSWLGSPEWSKPSLILISLMYIGPQMIIFLAGLKGIPTHLYEAAELDGAGPLDKVLHVTLPMLSPAIFFSMVTGIINAFQVFTFVFVTVGTGPMNSTLVYMLQLYKQAFQLLAMGYASALAWILFVMVMVLTLVQLRFSSWVYYEGAQKAQ